MTKLICPSLPAVTSSLLLTVMLTACGGGGSSPAASTATPPVATTLTVSGGSERAIAGGAAVTLKATPSDNSTVNWTLGAGNPGSLSASSGASVNYLPPASVGADTNITITASANGASKSYALTLRPADYPRLELLAGSDGGFARLDGTGTAARLNMVRGFSSDTSGNLYVAEDGPALRKVTPAGVVTTLLATEPGYVDGPKGTARLNTPASPVVGPDGSVYFTDADTAAANGAPHKVLIRKLASDGSISTISQFTLTAFDKLRLVADSKQLYAYQPEQISTVSFSGTVTTLTGVSSGLSGSQSSVDGNSTTARFSSIESAAADGKGNLYINDAGAIRKVAADGSVSAVAGVYRSSPDTWTLTQVDGTGIDARFVNLSDIAVTSAGNIVAYDYSSIGPKYGYTLRTITPQGVVSSAATSAIRAPGANLVAGPNNALYAQHEAQIDTVQTDGSTIPFAGKTPETGGFDGTGAVARFPDSIKAMGADAAGNLFVASDLYPGGLHVLPYGLSLRKITPAGVVTTIRPQAEVNYLSGMLVDAAGNVYVSTFQTQSPSADGRIFKITPDGNTTVLAGALPSTDWKDGVGTGAHFTNLALVSIDADGNLYGKESDLAAGTSRYTRITPAGIVTTIAVLPATPAVKDASGNSYSIDKGMVLRTTPAGVTSIIAGTPGLSFNYAGDLPGSLQGASHLAQTGPYSFAVFSGGAIMRLYVPH